MAFTQREYRQILEEFSSLADPKYKKFHESLIPGTQTAYGVRVPEIRRIARQIVKNDPQGFLALSQPASYEEIMLRGIVIGSMKAEIDDRLALTESFLPLIDNWAVCDTFCGSFSLKREPERERMWAFLRPLFRDRREFFARFAAVMFLGHFVTADYIEEGLALLSAMDQEQYYVQMAAAWALSVCYVKFPESTRALLEQKSLPKFVQNKSIQKIRESYRVSAKEKAALTAFKL